MTKAFFAQAREVTEQLSERVVTDGLTSYYADNGLVCAIHPYGPASNTCSSFVPRVNGLDLLDLPPT